MKDETEQYRWYIGLLGDGTYRFIAPSTLEKAERYIGKNGGGVYTHAGYLIFASNKRWWDWLDAKQDKTVPLGKRQPHIDVPNIECAFSKEALQWLEDNDALLKEIGGKYYDNIPRH